MSIEIQDEGIYAASLYCKDTGYTESLYVLGEETEVKVLVCVIEAFLGYNVYRLGAECRMVFWHMDREPALDYAIKMADLRGII